jgi:tRNA pseudouridine38-40 synthase
MINYKLIIAYDGRNFLGWQKTSMGPSIEEALQRVLEKILQHPVVLQAASRTDAGVHAKGQVVNFISERKFSNLIKLKNSLNNLLLEDIVVLHIEEKDPGFHPTLNCINKEYYYHICYGPTQMPHHRFYSWHYHYLLDIQKMRNAADYFLGTHDFSAFCNFRKNLSYSHYQRTIEELEIQTLETNRLCIRIKGPNFLYKMVRNIVGTLAFVGRGKIDPQEIPNIILSQNRVLAGMTAPAHGLFLNQVFY